MRLVLAVIVTSLFVAQIPQAIRLWADQELQAQLAIEHEESRRFIGSLPQKH